MQPNHRFSQVQNFKSNKNKTVIHISSSSQELGKMQPNYRAAASQGFFFNLSAVLLKLAGPFLDPTNANFWKRVDERCALLIFNEPVAPDNAWFGVFCAPVWGHE